MIWTAKIISYSNHCVIDQNHLRLSDHRSIRVFFICKKKQAKTGQQLLTMGKWCILLRRSVSMLFIISFKKGYIMLFILTWEQRIQVVRVQRW